MFEFRYSASLMVVHSEIDPAHISRRLGLSPSLESRAGAERYGSKGEDLNRKVLLSVWSCRLHKEPTLNSALCPLAEFLDTWLRKLSIHGEFFRELQAQGGQAQFKINWFSDSPCTTGVLPPNTLENLAELALGMELNVIADPKKF
jgi:hypothetical protein